MKKLLILLAGYPATGKTYLCNKIIQRFGQFSVISPDEIKENIWNKKGFSNAKEKLESEDIVWQIYYQTLETDMQNETPIISDYPFSSKQHDKLKYLAEIYDYRVITFRLIGDIDILYQRSLQRDLNPERHLGHLVTCYYPGDTLEDRSQADGLVTEEIFRERCLNRGYDKFQLGTLCEIDVTDYNKVNYDAILDQMNKEIQLQ